MTDGMNVAGPFTFLITVINLPPSIITPFQDITLAVGTTKNQIILSNFDDPEFGSSYLSISSIVNPSYSVLTGGNLVISPTLSEA